jgi:hypothetical protein
MKWLAFATIIILPPTAMLASQMSRHVQPTPLPRLINSQGLKTRAPVLGVLLVDTAPRAREE